MTTTGTPDVRKRLADLIGRRTHGKERRGSIEVARRAYEDLAIVLVTLVSQSGFDALVARALQLAQREYPSDAPSQADREETERFAQVSLWLERLDDRDAIEAAATLFASLAELLNTLIGESLTTRYLRKAWPDAFEKSEE